MQNKPACITFITLVTVNIILLVLLVAYAKGPSGAPVEEPELDNVIKPIIWGVNYAGLWLPYLVISYGLMGFPPMDFGTTTWDIMGYCLQMIGSTLTWTAIMALVPYVVRWLCRAGKTTSQHA